MGKRLNITTYSVSIGNSIEDLICRLSKVECVRIAFPVVLILCIHYFMQGAILGLGNLGEVDYYSSSLLLEAIWEPETLMILLPIATLAYLGRGEISWGKVDDSGLTKMLIFGSSGILAWYFSTYELNRYFQQEHLVDRIFLILLWIAVWKHPVWAVVFLWFVTVIACQFQYPIFEFSWFIVDKRLVYDVLLLFTSFLVVRIFFPVPRTLFFTLTLGLTGVFYSYAAWVKLREGGYFGSWVVENEILSLLLTSHQYGWLGSIETESLVDVWKSALPLNLPFGVATILVEGAGLLVLLHRRITPVIFLGFIGLHIMILASTGIFFWAWILFDFLLIGLLFRMPKQYQTDLFGRSNWLVALCVMVMGFVVFRPIDFVWFDGRAASPYRISAIGQSGNEYEIIPYSFSLYDLEMGQRRFHFLNPEKTLMGTYGSTTYEIAKVLKETTRSEYHSVVEEMGKVRFDLARKEAFSGFLERYLSDPSNPSLVLRTLTSLAPPHHFQVTVPDRAYNWNEPLVSLRVTMEDYFFDGNVLHGFQPKLILSRDLQPVEMSR